MSIFEYTFFQNAVIGVFLAGIVCAFVGTYIVSRRLVSLTGGITHASLGGVGIGVWMGWSPIVSALCFAVLSAFGIQWTSSRGGMREDSAVVVFWTLGMSIGILCCFATPGFIPELPGYLFGSILTVTRTDLLLIASLAVVAIVVFTVCYQSILSVAFDADFARSQGLNVTLIEYLMMALTAMTIVAVLRLVGIVLALSLLTIPQLTANLWTSRFHRIIIASILIGWTDCLAGLWISYRYNLPSGAAIIFVSIIVYFAARLLREGVFCYRRRILHQSFISQTPTH